MPKEGRGDDPLATPAAAERALERIGLQRLLRLGVAGAIPPLWGEVAVLHYRGSYHSKAMWLPIVYLPLEMAAGILAGSVDTRLTRRIFRAFSFGTAALGAFGTFMHLRGVRRQMGGFALWRYNGMTGPPVLAAPQVALFGLIGVLGTSKANDAEIIRCLRLLLITSELLMAAEAGHDHYKNYFANRVQYTPLVLAPALAAVQAAAQAKSEPVRKAGRRLETAVAAAGVVAGLVGFGFHLANIRKRPGGFSWQNLFYAAPLVAPLQFTGQGLFGLLASFFDRKERR